MNILYCTADEHILFDALPASLREGWKISEEIRPIADEPPRQRVRFKLLTLHDPSLKNLQEILSEKTDPDEIAEIISTMDLQGVSYDDLAELVFAMGPAVLSSIIAQLLRGVSTDDQLEDIAVLAFLRHELLSAK